MAVLNRAVGPLLQLAGAIAVVIGVALWLGEPAAWIAGGVLAVLVGVLHEVNNRTNFVVINEGKEVSISDEGTGTTS